MRARTNTWIRPARLAALLLPAACAFAGPANGLALYVGGVNANQSGLHSSGVSLGGDAQFAFNDRWSVNPCLFVSYEHAPGDAKVSDGLGGLQVRGWIGTWYLGGQVFYHDRWLTQGGSVTSSQYGPGLGVVTGWEGRSGWSVGAQLDALEGQFLNPGDRRTAVRMHVGYRWR